MWGAGPTLSGRLGAREDRQRPCPHSCWWSSLRAHEVSPGGAGGHQGARGNQDVRSGNTGEQPPPAPPAPPSHRSLRGGCASNRNEAAQPSPPPRGRAGSPRGLESWEVPSSRVGIQSWFSWERHGADTTRASRRGLWLCRAGQLRGKCPWPVSGPESRNFPTSTCTHPGTPS